MAKKDIENFQIYLNSFINVLKNFNITHSLVLPEDDSFQLPLHIIQKHRKLINGQKKKKKMLKLLSNLNSSIAHVNLTNLTDNYEYNITNKTLNKWGNESKRMQSRRSEKRVIYSKGNVRLDMKDKIDSSVLHSNVSVSNHF